MLMSLTSLTPKKSDLYSDLSQKEVTIGKTYKHWAEMGISEVRRLVTKFFIFRESKNLKLEIINFFLFW